MFLEVARLVDASAAAAAVPRTPHHVEWHAMSAAEADARLLVQRSESRLRRQLVPDGRQRLNATLSHIARNCILRVGTDSFWNDPRLPPTPIAHPSSFPTRPRLAPLARHSFPIHLSSLPPTSIVLVLHHSSIFFVQATSGHYSLSPSSAFLSFSSILNASSFPESFYFSCPLPISYPSYSFSYPSSFS